MVAFSPGLFADFGSPIASAAAQVGADVVIAIDDHTSLMLAENQLGNLGADDFRFG